MATGRKEDEVRKKILFPSFLCTCLFLAEWVSGIDHLESNSSSLTDKESKVNTKFLSPRTMPALKAFHTWPVLSCPTRMLGMVSRSHFRPNFGKTVKFGFIRLRAHPLRDYSFLHTPRYKNTVCNLLHFGLLSSVSALLLKVNLAGP